MYLFFGKISFRDALYKARSYVYIYKPGSYVINNVFHQSSGHPTSAKTRLCHI